MNRLSPQVWPLTTTTVTRSLGYSDVASVPGRSSKLLLYLTRTPLAKKFARRCGFSCLAGSFSSCGSSNRNDEGNVGEEGYWNWSCGEAGVVWEADRIARALDGELVRWGDPGSICTDSRKIKKGQWFLALVGPNFDGHQFLQQALDGGCVGAIGQYVDPDWPRGFVRVECGLEALHMLAAYVRKSYRGTVVGITGSTGKTTARAMTSLALQSLGYIHQTVGNLNNHFGVPLTLLNLPSSASACVLEMGMSAPGEIRVLAGIAEPSVRVLLNVGHAHMENFEKLEDVAAAKGELLRSAKRGDFCVLNADDPLVMGLILPPAVRVIFFGKQAGCHVRLVEAHATKDGRCVRVVLEQSFQGAVHTEKFSTGMEILENLRRAPLLSPGPAELDHWQLIEFEISSPGLHLAVNACAAASVAVAVGIPLSIISKSLTEYSPVGTRCKLEQVGDLQLINDTYNSNPMSLESGLRSLSSMLSDGKKIAFLGDMLELGTTSVRAHVDALLLCKELQVDFVGLVGPCFSQAAKSLDLITGNLITCGNSEELANLVAQILKPGDIVLIKGSRGMKMEVVADAIKSGKISS